MDLRSIDFARVVAAQPNERDDWLHTVMTLMAMSLLLKLGSIIVTASGAFHLTARISAWANANGASLVGRSQMAKLNGKDR